ncbi:hypothetical protein A7U60_g2193 [Sanghuangporus baumii]|uniref:Uncharacterized protein n=1 Tax=Sanghuangporus baumii TaxID=108892 RepID=A0A9Q5I2X4_SANBA|nr:hypothetical protein A7U60_g2193 [Sanghuangporus baumii]
MGKGYSPLRPSESRTFAPIDTMSDEPAKVTGLVFTPGTQNQITATFVLKGRQYMYNATIAAIINLFTCGSATFTFADPDNAISTKTPKVMSGNINKKGFCLTSELSVHGSGTWSESTDEEISESKSIAGLGE